MCGAAALLMTGCQTSVDTISESEFAVAGQAIKTKINSEKAPITKSIGLYEAMARALKYNLDHRVAMMETDLARADYDLSRYDLLPKVVASGGYFGRDNDPGANSISLLSGRESLEPSTSSEREFLSGDLTASWNILDFGLSKIRAEQLGNEALIYEERRRKAIIQIMEDVHRAYWRAVSSERLSTKLAALESDVETAFSQSRQLYAARQTAPMPALSYQRELNDIQGQAQKMSRELTLAKMELAALMGLTPSESFTLILPSHHKRPAELAMPLDEMIDHALKQRPEVRESAYAKRIAAGDIKRAALEALPSLEGFAGLNGNTNDFLFNQDWVSYGARVSWNLLDVFKTPMRKKRAKANATLEEQRGLAAAMAVMTQVGVSQARYQSLMREYKTANVGANVQSDILNQVVALTQAASASRQSLIRERMNTIISEARRDIVHAEMQEAAANIFSAMGYDPYSADIKGSEDIEQIAQSLETLWTQRGKSPAL
jgi:outer membrane protein TolC